MAEISAQLVKQLRERTGAGMMECKSALQEANGNIDAAETVLRKRGIASAAKKSSRTTRQGMIGSFVQADSQLGVLVEVNCESDFVARTDDFQQLLRQLSEHIAHADPQHIRPEDLNAEVREDASHRAKVLYEQLFHHDNSTTVQEVIKSKIAKLGENISVARLVRYAPQSGSVIGSYIHPGAQLGVLIELTGVGTEASQPEVQTLVRDIAMQIAAADPQFIRKEDVTTEALDKEKDIQRARALQEGKPEKMVDKIVEGRLNKFYEEICLLEQPFIRDNSTTVQELIKSIASKNGASYTVSRFSRYKVGSSEPVSGESGSQA